MARRIARLLLIAIIVLHAAIPLAAVHAQTTELPNGVPDGAKKAKIAKIEDGDKISIVHGEVTQTVLLAGIDAPEKGECYYKESKDYLAQLLPKNTIVYLQSSGDDRDGKDRLIRYVWLPSSKDGAKATLINTKLVREGYAGFDNRKDNPKYFDRLEELQTDAQAAGKGLWSACGTLHVKAQTTAQSKPTEKPAQQSAQQPTQQTTEQPSEQSGGSDTPKKDERCLDVSPEVQQALIAGLTDGGSLSLRGFQAVRSKDYEQVFFIAADIEGPGLEGKNDLGVWATNIIDTSGGIYLSVDNVAQEFSNYPDGDSTDANVTLLDDGVKQAKACTKAVLKDA